MMDARQFVFTTQPEKLRVVLERIDRILAMQPIAIEAGMAEFEQGYTCGMNKMRATIQDIMRGQYDDENINH
jgi:hypothetical protein